MTSTTTTSALALLADALESAEQPFDGLREVSAEDLRSYAPRIRRLVALLEAHGFVPAGSQADYWSKDD